VKNKAADSFNLLNPLDIAIFKRWEGLLPGCRLQNDKNIVTQSRQARKDKDGAA
jgi:hypothetical protein